MRGVAGYLQYYAVSLSELSSQLMTGAKDVQANQNKHRVRPRHLGRWLVLQQIDPYASREGHEVIAAQYVLMN
jgi:hypothetical protein